MTDPPSKAVASASRLQVRRQMDQRVICVGQVLDRDDEMFLTTPELRSVPGEEAADEAGQATSSPRHIFLSRPHIHLSSHSLIPLSSPKLTITLSELPSTSAVHLSNLSHPGGTKVRVLKLSSAGAFAQCSKSINSSIKFALHRSVFSV